MNNIEFALHFAEHVEAGILFAALTLFVNYLLFRRYIYSLFDPLLFYTVLSAMAAAVVLYLYYFDLIRPFYLWSYLATQTAFVVAFQLIRPPAPARNPPPHRRSAYSGPIRVLYPLSVTLFVSAQVFVYSVSGLPILLTSRLEAFSTGGGYGFFSRLIFVTSTISLCTAAYRLLLLNRRLGSRLLDYGVVAFCTIVAILSGSKGALLALVFTVSLAVYFARRFHDVRAVERRIRGVFFFVVALSFPVAFAAIYIQAGIEDFTELLSALAMRFFQTGEIFFMVYPDDVLSRLQDGNGLLALFYSPLGSLRLFSREELPVNLGLQAFWYHYDLDLISGPNARHNVFGLHYFGAVFSVFFSFLLGLLFSLSRNTAYRVLPATPVGLIVYVLIVNCAMFIEQDVSGQAIEYFFSVLLVFPVLYVVSAIPHIGRVRARRTPLPSSARHHA